MKFRDKIHFLQELNKSLEFLSKKQKNDEPDFYKLKDGSGLRRISRFQTADSYPDTHHDEWAIYDQSGKHVGNYPVMHSPKAASLGHYSPFSNFTEHEVPTIEMKPGGDANTKSYNEHKKLAEQHLPYAMGALAHHYGQIAADNEEHGHIARKANKENPNTKYFTTKQSRAQLNSWTPIAGMSGHKEYLDAMPQENWHHFMSSSPGKVDYKALENDPASTGGIYHGDEDGPKIPKKPDTGSMN